MSDPDEGGCHHGKWSQAGVPHRGWSCVDIYDDGEDGEELHRVCEMCETQLIRYVHVMQHPDWEGKLEVGCVCAGNMEEDYEGAKRREVDFKNWSARRRNWLGRRWRLSEKGNDFLNTGGFNVVVYQRGDGWAARVKHGDRCRVSQLPYKTADEAKLAAFDEMTEMQSGAAKEPDAMKAELDRLQDIIKEMTE
jgi:hypothetical protein